MNPWLVFVGPSPGNSPGRPIDWVRERMPTLGEVQVHMREYVDGTGFWNRMRTWIVAAYKDAGIFDDDRAAALGSALLANLVSEHQGDARRISDFKLEQATPEAVALLRKLRPRVIVPMEKRIGPLLVAELQRQGAKVDSGPNRVSVLAKNQIYSHYRSKVWRVSTDFGPVTLAESPQQPSKVNFYEPVVVDSYLGQIMREALGDAG